CEVNAPNLASWVEDAIMILPEASVHRMTRSFGRRWRQPARSSGLACEMARSLPKGSLCCPRWRKNPFFFIR
ncbi:MAG: hypothetical protein PVH13_11200, partial [Gammaproteobacteria bacterium]